MPSSTALTRIPSDVVGLDDVLMGGLIAGGFYLIQGDPGSGKTTMALQYALSRVSPPLTATTGSRRNRCRAA